MSTSDKQTRKQSGPKTDDSTSQGNTVQLVPNSNQLETITSTTTATTTNSQENIISPPSMTLRSGRKKRKSNATESAPTSTRAKRRKNAPNNSAATTNNNDEFMSDSEMSESTTGTGTSANKGSTVATMKKNLKQDKGELENALKKMSIVLEEQDETMQQEPTTTITTTTTTAPRILFTSSMAANTSESVARATINTSNVNTNVYASTNTTIPIMPTTTTRTQQRPRNFGTTSGLSSYEGITRLGSLATPVPSRKKPSKQNQLIQQQRHQQQQQQEQTIDSPPIPLKRFNLHQIDEINPEQVTPKESNRNNNSASSSNSGDSRPDGRRDGLYHYFRQVSLQLKERVSTFTPIPSPQEDESEKTEEYSHPQSLWKKMLIVFILQLLLSIISFGKLPTIFITQTEKQMVKKCFSLFQSRQNAQLPNDMDTATTTTNEEIIYIDNIQLEQHEKDLRLKRAMIAHYKNQKRYISELVNEYNETISIRHDSKVQEIRNNLDKRRKEMDSLRVMMSQVNDFLPQVNDALLSWRQSILDVSAVGSKSSSNGGEIDKSTLLVTVESYRKDAEQKLDQLKQMLPSFFGSGHEMQLLPILSLPSRMHPDESCTNENSSTVDDTTKRGDDEKEEEEYVSHTDDSIDSAKAEDILQAIRDALTDYALIEAKTMNQSQELDEFISNLVNETFHEELSINYPGKVEREEIALILDTIKEGNRPSEKSKSDTTGFTKAHVQKLIFKSKEKYIAGITGKFDYASISTGAQVIRSGIRSTSRSISENMPFINRLLSKAQLRFYGHTAEVALLPTIPMNAIGQCWSFEIEGMQKDLELVLTPEQKMLKQIQREDSNRGDYGTLAVNLSGRIHVSSVVIEHPPREVSPTSVGTAIRSFRVIGFEEEGALGHPWFLGEFEYKIDTTPLQEFQVMKTDEDGHVLPKMASIVLAIDSNWGADYSCLYRFRVHGLGY